MKKRTEDLIHEIMESKNISTYIDTNQDEFLDTTLYQHLQNLLAETDLKISQVVTHSYKGEYIYQVFRGIKNPGRDMLLCIALAMELGVRKTAQLLRVARMPLLDARNRRDSVLIFALERKLTVPDTNDILYELEEECL